MGMHKGFTRGAASAPRQEQTLGDYVERITKDDIMLQKKKLTFEEYWRTYLGGEFDFLDGGFSIEEAAALWNAAQENK